MGIIFSIRSSLKGQKLNIIDLNDAQIENFPKNNKNHFIATCGNGDNSNKLCFTP